MNKTITVYRSDGSQLKLPLSVALKLPRLVILNDHEITERIQREYFRKKMMIYVGFSLFGSILLGMSRHFYVWLSMRPSYPSFLGSP